MTGQRICRLSIVILSLALQSQAQSSSAQKDPAARVVESKVASKLQGRELPYRVLLPPAYDAKGQTRYSVIYLLHGFGGHFNNWTDRTKLATYALDHRFIIVTPEGNNGWYTDSVSVPTDKYESYITQELIPEIDRQYATIADREHRVIAGLSMGGYGSIKFGLKYPEKFFLVGSFSGAVATTSYTEKLLALGGVGAIGASVDATFGAENSDARKANDIFGLIRDASADKIKSLPFIYISSGTEDALVFSSNRDFLTLLTSKKVPHEYREHPGVHNWDFWDDQIRDFLGLADRMIKK